MAAASGDVKEQALALVRRKNKIEAIKLVRERLASASKRPRIKWKPGRKSHDRPGVQVSRLGRGCAGWVREDAAPGTATGEPPARRRQRGRTGSGRVSSERWAAGSFGSSDAAAAPAHAQKDPSGLAWIVLAKGSGTEAAGPSARVLVQYTGGWTRDGRMCLIVLAKPERVPSCRRWIENDSRFPGWSRVDDQGRRSAGRILAALAYGDDPAREGAICWAVFTFDVGVSRGYPRYFPLHPKTLRCWPLRQSYSRLAFVYRVLREVLSS